MNAALVTGAARGIGQAVVALLREANWQVLGADLAPGDAADVVAADVADEVEVAALVDESLRRFGRLDAVVGCAGVHLPRALAATTAADWDRLMAVNLRAAFLLARAAQPALRASRGAIVHVASVHALATTAEVAAYAASKGGLISLTRALALEFAADGIRVNCVVPGAIDTDMLRAGVGRNARDPAEVDARLQALASRTPAGRIGQPREVAQAVLFLADPERSGFVDGQVLVVDGGALARLGSE